MRLRKSREDPLQGSYGWACRTLQKEIESRNTKVFSRFSGGYIVYASPSYPPVSMRIQNFFAVYGVHAILNDYLMSLVAHWPSHLARPSAARGLARPRRPARPGAARGLARVECTCECS